VFDACANGFVSRAVLKWLTQANIDTARIDPGKPWQTATNESFNGKFRDQNLGDGSRRDLPLRAQLDGLLATGVAPTKFW
jgi:hypothetical protein